MSEKKRRIIETLDGIGKVYQDDDDICKVQYHLKIVQEFIISRSYSGTEEIPGLKDISGQIQVIEGEKNLIDGNILILNLEDGRRWSFFASRGDFISGTYQVTNASGKGIIAE